MQVKEFPINTYSFFGKPIIYSGGGYFRFLNYRIIRYFSKKNDYIMSYFHPRDFDYNQPILEGLSLKRKFKSYVGIKNCKVKLEKWVSEFDFIDLKTADKMIDWKNTHVTHI